jgi:hypothetical protein
MREWFCYIKRVVFPLFCFSPSPSSLIHHTHPLCLSLFSMTSYAKDIIRLARDATGPSIRDMEVIRSFQSRPAQKDAVSVSFVLFYNCDIHSAFSLEWDVHLFGSPGY